MAITKTALKSLIASKRGTSSEESFDRESAKSVVSTKIQGLLVGDDAQKSEDLSIMLNMITELADYCSVPGRHLRSILVEVINEERDKLDLGSAEE